ncbi:MAG: hypothetical protein NUV34_05155, partial [Sulfuricaulis sp.]|nr:hypothetical protein [Sulfuricaulis sp.]
GTTDEEALNMTRARFWGELYRLLPTLSAWTAMEAGGMANDPLAEMIRRAGEDVFLSPEFRQIRTATGAESFGELAKMLAMMAGGAPGAPPTSPGAASDLSLVKQDTMASPVESRVVTEALINRDTDQGGAALRAPSG